MISSGWGALVLALVLGAALVAWLSFNGRIGGLRRPQKRRIECPRSHEPADCVLVQDIRTGQWKELRSCSALAPGATCEVDCAKLLNLGYRLREV